MPVQWMVGIGYVVMAGCLAAVFIYVARDKRTQSWDEIYQRATVLRTWWFRGLLAFAVVAFAISMTWLPYQFVRSAELPGTPTKVAVTGHQFAWDLDKNCLPTTTPLEFDVASADVTHGFAIYDENGHIVGQTQAMPGYTNVLLVSLTKPGTYTIHCTELCGVGHSFMKQTFTVGSCGSSAAAGSCGGGAGCA
jgi:cytochrome c oxidase subunit 2